MGLGQKESDLQMMLAAKALVTQSGQDVGVQCHMGTKNVDYQMERYVYKRRSDGLYIINLAKTYEKLQLAARIIVAIENPQDIVAQSARPYGQRAVLKFAHYTGCKAIAGRHTPGTFTNQIQKMYEEPRLLILTDPFTDNQPIKEASYVNIPTIAFCDTDAPLSHVDVAIPANNKGAHSVGCLYYLLTRMVCQMRDSIPQDQPWDVMVDLFFYREPEEAKEEAAEEEGAMVEAGFGAPAALPGTEGFAPEAVAGTYADPTAGFPGAAAPASGAQWPDGGAGMGFAAAAPPAEGLQYSAPESFGAAY